MPKNAILISLSSDIALELVKHWSNQGWNIVGTYRHKPDTTKFSNKITLFHCDLNHTSSCDDAAKNILHLMPSWDVLIFATGTLMPLGPFLENDIDAWMTSIHINFVNQIRLTHQLINGLTIPINNIPTVIFFAGGGTNNAVLGCSAYTISKIALIKMCELLDAEIHQVKFSILGPGWIKTKIHNETLDAGKKANAINYTRTVERLEKNNWTPMSNVVQFIDWIINQPKEVVGGRNFSVVYDDIHHENFINKIINTPNMYKLRRFMNEAFIKQDQHE